MDAARGGEAAFVQRRRRPVLADRIDLATRIERAIAEGDLPRGTNAADLAKYLSVVTQGMSVQAAGGATRAELRKVAELALKNWPTS